jgi:site-specific recombinase XerD
MPAPAASVGDMEPMIASFRRDLRAANRSPRTIDVYVSSAKALLRFLRDHGMPTKVAYVTREHVGAYIESVVQRQSPATASVRYRSLQQFFKWAIAEGETGANPMPTTRPIVPEKPMRVLTDEGLRALLATCDPQTEEGRRDEAILRVFIDSGARLSEVAGLTMEDVDLDGGVLRVFGNGHRARMVGIGAKTCKALDRYLRRRGILDGPLWVGRKGPMTASGIRQIAWRRSEEAGIGRVHPNAFRHTHAHRWLAEGGSEAGLMRKAGWRSRAMLSRYASSPGEAMALEESRRLGLGDRL